MNRKKLVGVAVTLLAAIVTTVHVLQHRFAVAELNRSITAITIPDSSHLDTAEVSEFLRSISTINASVDQIGRVETRANQLTARATWIQRLFTKPPSAEWMEPLKQQLTDVAGSLPAISLSQSQRLTAALLTTAPEGGANLKQEASMYKAQRSALLAAAAQADTVLRSLLAEPLGAAASVRSDRAANQVESWIDRSAQREQEALSQGEEALAAASRAAAASNRLRQAAPAREIAPVADLWSQASQEAHAAVRILRNERPPRRVSLLYVGLVAPARERLETVAREIDENLRTIRSTYQIARSEESTVRGRLTRFGRRTVASTRKYLVTTAAQLDSRATELSDALSSGIDRAVLSSMDIVSEGMRVYQDSRRPTVVRFMESDEGLVTMVIAGAFLVVVVVLGVIVRRGTTAV